MKKSVVSMFTLAVLFTFIGCEPQNRPNTPNKDKKVLLSTMAKVPSMLGKDSVIIDKQLKKLGFVKTLSNPYMPSSDGQVDTTIQGACYTYPSDFYADYAGNDSVFDEYINNLLINKKRTAIVLNLEYENNQLGLMKIWTNAATTERPNQVAIFNEVSNQLYSLLSEDAVSKEWKGMVYSPNTEDTFTVHNEYLEASVNTTLTSAVEGGYAIYTAPLEGICYMGFWEDQDPTALNMSSFWGIATAKYIHEHPVFWPFLPQP